MFITLLKHSYHVFFALQVSGFWPHIKMASSLLFTALTVFLYPLGGLIQASFSLDNSDLVRTPRSTGGNSYATDRLSSEFASHLQSSSDSLEGSGQSSGSAALETFINRTAIPKRPESAGNVQHAGSWITITSLQVVSTILGLVTKETTYVTTEEHLMVNN